MYLISTSDFVGRLKIPNINEPQTEVSVDVNRYIDDKVRLFLRETLGNVLFKDLDSDIVNGELKSDAAQKWKDLVNGKEYNGLTWLGLLQPMTGYKKSLLTNYVFCEWVRENSTSLTGVGNVRLQGKNAIDLNANPILVSVWNEFVQAYQKERTTKFPKVKQRGSLRYLDYLENNEDKYVSMLRFLQDNKSDYPGITYKLYPLANSFGL